MFNRIFIYIRKLLHSKLVIAETQISLDSTIHGMISIMVVVYS